MMDHGELTMNRAARRKGSNPASGGSNADDHLRDLVGSNAIWIYLTPNKRLKGFDDLRQLVESRGYLIGLATDAPIAMGKGYQQLKIGTGGASPLPTDIVRAAHRWAHRHNFLHSFFKPNAAQGAPQITSSGVSAAMGRPVVRFVNPESIRPTAPEEPG
jgi:hypothetical protein